MTVLRTQDIALGKQSFHEWELHAIQDHPHHCSLRQEPLSQRTITMAVRYTLWLLEQRLPGNSLEIRIAPIAAIKVCEGVVSNPHNLTPPETIELSPETWLRLASGITTWQEESELGHITALQAREELINALPIVE